jgi:arylsulfatase A-like enzyme
MVLDAAGDATVLVMSDHGGHERTHGTLLPEDMTIPFILSGKGIASGVTIQKSVIIYDAAPTLAAAMGLPRARQWDGVSLLDSVPGSARA